MQHIISKLLSLVVLLLLMGKVQAQYDSLKMEKEALQKMKDSLRLKYNIMVLTEGDGQPLKVERKYKDSVYGQLYRTQKYKAYDSLRSFNTKRVLLNDSTRMKRFKTLASKNMRYPDSLQRIYNKQARVMKDSMRLYGKFRRMDSLRYRAFDSVYSQAKFYKKWDSLKIKELKSRILQDSFKMQQLKFHNTNDSLKLHSQQKGISMEVAYKKGFPVYIVNTNQNVVVSTNNGNTVKLSSRVPADKDLSDKQWFELMEVDCRNTDSGTSIRVTPSMGRTTTVTRKSNMARDSFTLVQKAPAKTAGTYTAGRILYVSVPVDAPLKIITNYADVALENNISSVSIDINNGKFKMLDGGRLLARSRYAGLQAGNIGDADVEINNSTLTTASVNTLVIDSKNSNVHFGRMETMRIKSINDQYELQQVNNLAGDKTFGRLSIQSLHNDLDINASSADIKIARINVNAGLVKINNRYANISLPLNMLANYTVSVEGSNSHVLRGPDANLAGGTIEKKQQQFTASAGNVSGTHTRLQLNCNSCMIDLR